MLMLLQFERFRFAVNDTFVIFLPSIRWKLGSIIQDYENRVRCFHNKLSLRVRNKLWMDMDVPQPKRESRGKHINNYALFDIGKNTNKLTRNEAIFCQD